MKQYVYAGGDYHADNLRGPIVDLTHGEIMSEDAAAIHFVMSRKICYYSNGELHREDGPAVIYISDPELSQWWYNGKQCLVNNQSDFNKMISLKAFW